jgi:two-component system sensor histidine kinase UhpB
LLFQSGLLRSAIAKTGEHVSKTPKSTAPLTLDGRETWSEAAGHLVCAKRSEAKGVPDNLQGDDAGRKRTGRQFLTRKIPAPSPAEAALRDGELRLRHQHAALVRLIRMRTRFRGQLRDALWQITESAAHALEVARVSVWLFNADRSKIRCLDLFVRATGVHSEGNELSAKKYPAYFMALAEEFTVAAHDACLDPRTREFAESYLAPSGITSILDAPIRLSHELVGVVCHEHIGSPRRWTLDEQNFAGSIADLASLAIEEDEARKAEIYKAAFTELGHRLSAAITPKAAAEIIAHAAARIWGWDVCYLHLRSQKEKRMIPVLNYDTIGGRRVDTTLETGSREPVPLMERVANEGAKLILLDPQRPHDDGLIPFSDKNRDSASLMFAPIRHCDKVVGVLSIQSYRPDAYDSKALDGLQALADQCAGALERIHAEQALRESEKRFASFMKNTKVVAWMKDANFRYVYVNPAFERLHGVHLEELRGTDDFAFLSTQTAQELRANDEAVFRSGRALETYEMVPGCDGRERYWWVYKFPFQDAAGRRFVGGMAVDITERKRAEEVVRRLSGRILEAGEAERRRVSRELHDSVNQLLASVRFRIQSIEGKIAGRNKALRQEALKARELLERALQEVRRISRNLRPSELDDLGLLPALRSLCEDFQERTDVAVILTCSSLVKCLSTEVGLAVYRIVQEGLSNVQKHARATQAVLQIRRSGDSLELRVRDNGKGFRAVPGRSHRTNGHGFGLMNMRERAVLLGGSLDVISRPGSGTEIVARIPVNEVRGRKK